MRYKVFGIVVLVIIIAVLLGLGIYLIYRSRRPNRGAACSTDGDCKGGTICDPVARVCVSKTGDACNTDSDCIVGDQCANGRCIGVIPPPIPPIIPVVPPVVPPITPTPPTPTPPTPASPVPQQVQLLSSPITDRNYVPSFGISDSSFTEPDVNLVSTPYVNFDGKLYCKAKMDETIAVDSKVVTSAGNTVIDVANFSSAVLFLLENGLIIKEIDNHKSTVKSNVMLESFVKHMGRLYGLSGGSLYILDNGSYNNTVWCWNVVDWAPVGIINASATLDNEHLFLQSETKGFLYNDKLEPIQTYKLEAGTIRVYGVDVNQYIDIHQPTCKAIVHDYGQVRYLDDICSAVITCDGHIVAINRSNCEDYDKIRYINWQVYYINSKGRKI